MNTEDVLFSDLAVNDKFLSDGLLFKKTSDNQSPYKPNNAICQAKRIPCYVPAEAIVVKIEDR